jgi:hypothetical protein
MSKICVCNDGPWPDPYNFCPSCGNPMEIPSPSDATACSQVVESRLTVAQVEYVHCFGECWIKDYDRTKREYWEKALWLWAWDRKVIWQQNRLAVPAGLNPANV